jgi:hypothetical protein
MMQPSPEMLRRHGNGFISTPNAPRRCSRTLLAPSTGTTCRARALPCTHHLSLNASESALARAQCDSVFFAGNFREIFGNYLPLISLLKYAPTEPASNHFRIVRRSVVKFAELPSLKCIFWDS